MPPTDSPSSPAPTRRELRARREQLLQDTVAMAPLPVGETVLPPSDADEPVSLEGAAQAALDIFAPAGEVNTADTGATALLPAPAETAIMVPAARAVSRPAGAVAPLSWVDPRTLGDAPESHPTGPLLARRTRRGLPGSILVPLVALIAALAVYAGTMLLWPLHAVTPTATATELTLAASPAETITWPAQGSAAVGIEGIGTLSSSAEPAEIASITKLVTALLVLDRLPLTVGESGPSYAMTWADRNSYQNHLWRGESALDVPVGEELTEYQLLQGLLIGSASNYADRLVQEIWGSETTFVAEAARWLRLRGLESLTIVEPTGIDTDNSAPPADLIRLAQVAMANPVIAEIVGTAEVEIPGAGLVENTNELVASDGLVGVKTGTLWGRYNLLSAVRVPVGETSVLVSAVVLGQDDTEQRDAETLALLAQVTGALQAQGPLVSAGTLVAEVSTLWGETIRITTASDARVVLWNGAAATPQLTLSLDGASAAGAAVGTLTLRGPIDEATTEVTLTEDLSGPSPWWRLTHPLQLLGLAD